MTRTKLRKSSRPPSPAPNAYATIAAAERGKGAKPITHQSMAALMSGGDPAHPTQSLGAQAATTKAKAPSPAAVQTAVARLQTIPGPAPLPSTEAERDAVLARVAPPAAPQETWRQAFLYDLRLTGRVLRRFVELVGEAVIAVAAPLLTAAVDGLAVIVFVLTIWELWAPAKAIADHLAASLFDGAG